MSGRHPSLGMSVLELPTPSLLVDLDAFESNCAAISGRLGSSGVNWRPHVKGHKSPALARRMLAAGAVGVTCAKVAEAEEMVAAGIPNILIANQPSTVEAWDRLARLQHVTWVGAAVDNPEHVRMAVQAGQRTGVDIPLLVEVNVGMDRAGVNSPEAAVSMAKEITSAGATLAGLMGYEGHILTVWPAEEKRATIRAAIARLTDAVDAVRAAGMPVDIVSCGGSGSYEIVADIEGVTEAQAGGGCLMDHFYRDLCHVDLEQALFVVASVGSRPSEDRAIIDAGWKAMPHMLATPSTRDREGIDVIQVYAEHSKLAVSGDADPKIGERIVFIPGYSDATTVLHNEFLGIRNDVVVEVIPLLARGALQ